MKDRRKLFPVLSLIILLALMFGATASVWAQSLVSGDVTGTITDPSGAVLPNVPVTLKSNSTGATRTTNTNQSGFYRFALVQPGVYTILASPQGFQEVTKVVNVATGQTTSANLQTKVGAASTTVQVTAETPVVQADTSEISTSYDQRQVSLLPNPGGDITYIAQSAPGVTPNTSGGYGNFSSFGLPTTANLFTINGENDMDPYFNVNNSGATNLTLGQNDVQEATVVNNPYSGQYGQQAGAQVNYVTKSGSNDFHGNLEYWWNGRALNTADWFSNNSPDPAHQDQRPFANNNQWAASIGGPIKKDSTFFFVNTEGIRFVLPSVAHVSIPTPAFAAGILSNVSQSHPDEVANYTTMLNTMLNAKGAAGAVPTDGSCGTYNGAGSASGACLATYTAGTTAPSDEWILSGRIDHNFGANSRLFGRYRQDKGTQATHNDVFSSALNATSKQPSYDGQLQLTTTIGTKSTNQFIAAGSYYRAIFAQDEAAALAVSPVDFFFTGFNLGYFDTQYGSYRYGIVSQYPQGRNVTQYQGIDDFSVSKGNHDLKFGVNFRRYDISDFFFSFLNNPRVYAASLTDFANGTVTRYRERFPSSPVQPVALYGLGFYVQDEWRATKNLRLTLALRAEHNSNPVCNTNCVSRLAGPFQDISHDVNQPYNQAILSGLKQGYPATNKVNWGPRVGFAWSPMGNQRTVLRGGFGIFYDSLPATLVEQSMLNPPGLNEFNYRSSAATGLPPVPWVPTAAGSGGSILAASNTAFVNGFATGGTLASISATAPVFTPPSIFNPAGTFSTPRFQEWNLEVQQAIGTKSAISINYVGNHGIHIPINNEGVNAVDDLFGTGFGGLPIVQPDPRFATVQQVYTAAVSNYNGITTSFQRKFGKGLSMQASYTWAHAMDEVSNGGVSVYGSDSDQYQFNPYNLRSNYGNADYDVRHSFNANYVWELPFKFGNAFLNQVVGGWTFSGNFFTRSGLPYTVEDSNIAFTGYGAGAAFPYAQLTAGVKGGQLSCNDPGSAADHECLNFNGFADPTNFDGQRRNQFRGPKFFDTDLGVLKNFKIKERATLGVGANFYNILNHPNFANPLHDFGLCGGTSAGCAGSGFGTITNTVAVPTSPYGSFVGAAVSGRVVQIQAKLTF